MGKHEGERLVFDIEVSPCLVWCWRPGYNINVPAANIREEGKIICISYKFENDKKVHSLQWDKSQNDKEMLKKFIPIMQEAGEVIGHNHRGFDIKWLRTRCLFHRLPCPPTFVTIDTWSDAKKYFRFNSNSLSYITSFLGLEGKIDTGKGAGLWERVVFDKDKKALREMVKYCERDVYQTAKVFAEFAPYTEPTGHRGISMQDCPHCGSMNTKLSKNRITAKGTKTVSFQCQECGKYAQVAAGKWYNNKSIL